MDINERRLYQRGEHFYIEAKMSRDKNRWKKATISNLSSGGLQLVTEDKFEVGDIIWFDLVVQGFFSMLETTVKTEIRNKKAVEDKFAYGAVFLDLSPDKKIFIDENIKKDRPVTGDTYDHND